MMTSKLSLTVVLAWLSIFGFSSQALAQQSPLAGNTALQNASGTTLGGRTPGNMVGAGIIRTQNRVDPAFVLDWGHISGDDDPRPEPYKDFLVEAIQIIFQQLNPMLSLFFDMLLAREGIDSTLSLDSLFSNTGSGDPTRDTSQGRK